MSSYSYAALGELCSVNIGRTPRRNEAKYWGGPHPWATIRDLDGSTLMSTEQGITDAAIDEVMPKPVEPNTLLFSFKLSIGKMAFSGRRMHHNEAIAALPIRNSEILDREFLFHALKAKTHDTGANHAVLGKVLNKRKVEEIEIPLPPLDEQRQIVGILNRAAKIERLRAQAADRLREFIPALFVKMFGDPEKDPMGKKLPTETIGKLCKLINGRAFKPTDWVDTGMPIVRIQNLRDPSKPMNKFDGEVKDKFLIDSGDVLLSWSGTPGTSFGCFIWDRGRAILNQHIFRVEYDSSRIERDFFVHAMNSRLDEMIDRAHGGVGLRHITKSELNKIKLPVPPLDEQRRFTKIVETAHTVSTIEVHGSSVAGKLTESLMSCLLR